MLYSLSLSLLYIYIYVSRRRRDLVNAKDPEIMSHVCIIFVSDTLWSGIVSKRFVGSKIWFSEEGGTSTGVSRAGFTPRF